MENVALTSELAFAGLIIGLFLSLPIAAITSGICNALQPSTSQHKVGIFMIMIYVPLFAYLMRNMTEVLPMVIGALISSILISIAVMLAKTEKPHKISQSQQCIDTK